MESTHFDNIDTQKIPSFIPGNSSLEFSVLRLDKIHSEISGNKWFKLKFYLDDAINKNKKIIITFGGAWSNHILATAATCKLKGLQSIGIIRGEKPAQLSFTLKRAADHGMKLIFISRDDYQKKIMPAELIALSDTYIINEGGYGEKGMLGAATIAEYYKREEFTHICCAVGTGTMMAGLISVSTDAQEIIGFSVLKNNLEIENKIESHLAAYSQQKKYSINHDYHFGGYAKCKPALIDFMNEFYRQTSIPTDFVYTAKMVFGVYELAAKGFFPARSRILIIHSGGLQGNNSLPYGSLIF